MPITTFYVSRWDLCAQLSKRSGQASLISRICNSWPMVAAGTSPWWRVREKLAKDFFRLKWWAVAISHSFFLSVYVCIYIYVCVCGTPPLYLPYYIYIFICGIYLVHFIYEFQGTFHHAVVRKLSKFPNTVAWTETMEITNKLLLIISWYINPKSGS